MYTPGQQIIFLTFEIKQYSIVLGLCNVYKKCSKLKQFIKMFTSSAEKYANNYQFINRIKSKLKKVS